MQKASKVILTLVLCLSLLMPMTACMNPISLEKYGYVLTIGVDEGEKKKYEITLELQRELAGAEQNMGPGGVILLSEQGDTIFEAINTLYRRLAFDLSFARTYAFVFGKKIAESGKMQDFFEMSLEKLRIRQSAILLIAEGTAKEFLGGRNANNEANATRVHENLLQSERTIGETSIMNIGTLFESCEGRRFDVALTYGAVDDKIVTDAKQQDIASTGENPIEDPKDKLGGMQTHMDGAALFDGWKMVSKLSAHDTQILNIASGRFNSGSIMMNIDKDLQYVILTKLADCRIGIEMDDGIKADINLTLSITIEQDPTGELGRTWEEKGKKMVTDYFESELERVAKHCQEVNSDAIGIGRYVSKQFNSVEEWEAFCWKDIYPEIEIEFNAEIVLGDIYIAITRQ